MHSELFCGYSMENIEQRRVFMPLVFIIVQGSD